LVASYDAGDVGGERVPMSLLQEHSRVKTLSEMREGGLVYLVVGVVVASSHHYFTHVSTLKPILSVLLAVVLWPLLLLGVNLHIK
jgi:hypothetical protein